jgi:hypothetical protein
MNAVSQKSPRYLAEGPDGGGGGGGGGEKGGRERETESSWRNTLQLKLQKQE